ncbi:MAG: Snf7 family protein [Candidatus Eisenbacteria sp.]|nr:Snf7 family protein [Candidatus Eisenbacteria bacterium]
MRLLENRRKRKEIERSVRFRQGKSKIQSFIRKGQEARKRYWKLGEKALRLGDKVQFRQIARTYLWTVQQTQQWERFLLMLETFEARRDQMTATSAFIDSMGALSKSIMAGADPAQLAKMQTDMEMALGRAQCMEESLAAVMDSSAEVLFPEGEGEEDVQDLEHMILDEAKHGESAELDRRIEAGIAQLEETMRQSIEAKG